jgi:hypothetical protein
VFVLFSSFRGCCFWPRFLLRGSESYTLESEHSAFAGAAIDRRSDESSPARRGAIDGRGPSTRRTTGVHPLSARNPLHSIRPSESFLHNGVVDEIDVTITVEVTEDAAVRLNQVGRQ